MKFTQSFLAVAFAGASGATPAAPVAWTGEFVVYDPVGLMMNASDGAVGNAAYVTGVIDAAAGTFTASSADTFFGLHWSFSGGTLFGPGTDTHSTVDLGGASGGDYTFTVGDGQLGGVVDFAYGATTGIDTVIVWDVATAGGMTTYTSTDCDGDGIPGAPWIGLRFPRPRPTR